MVSEYLVILLLKLTNVISLQNLYGGSEQSDHQSLIPSDLLDRPTTSDLILSKDSNGDCYFPPFCKLDTTKCNIPKISYKTIENNPNIFYNNYVSKNKPVIIQFCPQTTNTNNSNNWNNSTHNNCDLSMIINNKTGIFNWETIISHVRSNKDYNDYISIELNGTMRNRSQTCDIHSLNDKPLLLMYA